MCVLNPVDAAMWRQVRDLLKQQIPEALAGGAAPPLPPRNVILAAAGGEERKKRS